MCGKQCVHLWPGDGTCNSFICDFQPCSNRPWPFQKTFCPFVFLSVRRSPFETAGVAPMGILDLLVWGQTGTLLPIMLWACPGFWRQVLEKRSMEVRSGTAETAWGAGDPDVPDAPLVATPDLHLGASWSGLFYVQHLQIRVWRLISNKGSFLLAICFQWCCYKCGFLHPTPGLLSLGLWLLRPGNLLSVLRQIVLSMAIFSKSPWW